MKAGFAAIVLLVLAPRADAHETWLLPDRFVVAAGQSLTIDLTSGMHFPAPDHAIRRERVGAARMRIGDRIQSIDGFRRGARALQLLVRPGRDGWATSWITLPAKGIVLDDAHVATYLDEIGADQATRDAWKGMHARGPWRERYSKSAKTLVASGSTRGDASWGTPVGLPLEFIAERAPDTTSPDGSMRFRLLWHGRPLAGAAIGVMAPRSSVAQYTGQRMILTTDADGAVAVPADPGRALLLYAVRLSPDRAKGTWTSDFTTLTLMPMGSTTR